MSKRKGNKYFKKHQWNWEGIKSRVSDAAFFFEQKFRMAGSLFGKDYRVSQRDDIMKKILNDKWYQKYQEQERRKGNIK